MTLFSSMLIGSAVVECQCDCLLLIIRWQGFTAGGISYTHVMDFVNRRRAGGGLPAFLVGEAHHGAV